MLISGFFLKCVEIVAVIQNNSLKLFCLTIMESHGRIELASPRSSRILEYKDILCIKMYYTYANL